MLPIPFPPRQPGFPHGRVRSETRWKRKFPFQSEVTKARLLICRRFAALPTFLSVSRCEGSRVARGDKDMVSFRVTKNAYASELAHLLAVLACLRYVSQSPPSIPPCHPSSLPSFSAIAELRSHRRRLHEKSYQRTNEGTRRRHRRR